MKQNIRCVKPVTARDGGARRAQPFQAAVVTGTSVEGTNESLIRQAEKNIRCVKLLLPLLFLIISAFVHALPAQAQKYVLTITPAQQICTKEDAISKGDILEFKTTKDLYVDDRLFIAKDTQVNAKVGYVQGDSWMGEMPIMTLSYFETKDVTGDPVAIEYPLNIKGKYGLSTLGQFTKYYVKSLLFMSNLDIAPGQYEFNVLFEK